jgi:hypothetical protein
VSFLISCVAKNTETGARGRLGDGQAAECSASIFRPSARLVAVPGARVDGSRRARVVAAGLGLDRTAAPWRR